MTYEGDVLTTLPDTAAASRANDGDRNTWRGSAMLWGQWSWGAAIASQVKVGCVSDIQSSCRSRAKPGGQSMLQTLRPMNLTHDCHGAAGQLCRLHIASSAAAH